MSSDSTSCAWHEHAFIPALSLGHPVLPDSSEGEGVDTPMSMTAPWGLVETTPTIYSEDVYYHVPRPYNIPSAHPRSGQHVDETNAQSATEWDRQSAYTMCVDQQSICVEPHEPDPTHAHVDQVSTGAGSAVAVMPIYICFFNGLCSYLDSDTLLLKKTSCVESHLEGYHWATSALWKDRYGKFICQWNDGHGQCGKDVSDRRQMAKHIATVHLELFKIRCGGCEKDFSRLDSLRRHEREGRCLRGQGSSATPTKPVGPSSKGKKLSK